MELVKKGIQKRGSRAKRPALSSFCEVRLLAPDLNEPGESEWFANDDMVTLEIGTSSTEFDRAVEKALYDMDAGESSEFECTLSEGEHRCLLIEFLSVTNYKAIYEWTKEELRSKSEEYKNRGRDLFELGRHVDAFHYYSRSLKLMLCFQAKNDHRPDTHLMDSLYGNLALCHLKRNNYEQAIYLCDKGLSMSVDTAKHVKFLYRKGVALGGLRQFSEAFEIMRAAIRLDPNNKAVMQECHKLRKLIEEQEAPLKKGMQKMFGNV